jgi:hypothetical protein
MFNIFENRPHFTGSHTFLRRDHTSDQISEWTALLTETRRKCTPPKSSRNHKLIQTGDHSQCHSIVACCPPARLPCGAPSHGPMQQTPSWPEVARNYALSGCRRRGHSRGDLHVALPFRRSQRRNHCHGSRQLRHPHLWHCRRVYSLQE